MRPVEPRGMLDAVVQVPGSKSYTQRALIIASLAKGASMVKDALVSEDTQLLMDALAMVGAVTDRQGQDILIRGTEGRPAAPSHPLYLGNNGTGLRLLTGTLCVGQGTFILDGSDRMRQRPIKPLVDALNMLGASVSCGPKGCPPVEVRACGLAGGKTTLAAGLSSQYLSSLLIAAPLAKGDVVIDVQGPLPSRPYVQMTLQVMESFGVQGPVVGEDTFRVKAPQEYGSAQFQVEGDASSATYFMAAAAICGGRVRIENVDLGSAQGDLRFVEILKAMGCEASAPGRGLEIIGPLSNHDDLAFDLHDAPDMVPALAVVAAFRKGKTALRNIGHLRIKESDRIAALTNELRKIGAEVEEKAEEMVVQGVAHRGSTICCYNDHRIAMSFAIAGLALEGIVIEDPDCVKKSFPNFWEKLESLR
jgi:3-phosphoshikimate 1-carboxyvinyltransferase